MEKERANILHNTRKPSRNRCMYDITKQQTGQHQVSVVDVGKKKQD